jgi:hypothetical protein
MRCYGDIISIYGIDKMQLADSREMGRQVGITVTHAYLVWRKSHYVIPEDKGHVIMAIIFIHERDKAITSFTF